MEGMLFLQQKGKFIVFGESELSSIAFSPDMQIVATANWDDGNVNLWDRHGSFLRTLEGESKHPVVRMAFSPNGQILAAGGKGGEIQLWHVESGTLTVSMREHHTRVTGLSFSPDGRLLVSGGQEGNLLLWSVVGDSILPPRVLVKSTVGVRGWHSLPMDKW